MDTSNNKNETFKSHQILAAVSVNIPSSQASVYRKINNLITSGVITRTARNTYILSHNNLKLYDFDFSNLAKNIISIINKNFVNLKFNLFETRQFNEFMNLQISKNTIFLSIESGLENYVFKTLSTIYPGKVLLKPDKDTMWTYIQENTIIIVKLPTEAPISLKNKYLSIPEKFLVDLVADNLLKEIIAPSQIEYIYNGFLNSYQIDKKKMFRYARRRTCENKIKEYVAQYEE